MFSVALSLGSPPVAVSDHPALWSSDFPPAYKQAITRPPSAKNFNHRERREHREKKKIYDIAKFVTPVETGVQGIYWF